MLRYDVRLNGNSFKRNELVWGEKYLSPDLSYIAGTTSPSNHLEMFTNLAASNSINNMDNTLSVESTNVIREGYVILREKEFEVKSGTCIDYSMLGTLDSSITYNYVFINGKYFYEHEISNRVSGYTIDNLQYVVKEYDDSSDEVEEVNVIKDFIEIPTSNVIDNKIKIDVISWIEDGIVEIDGEKYFYDKNEVGGKNIENGVLKNSVDGKALDCSSITICQRIECVPYPSTNQYEEVTKFVLKKEQSAIKEFSNISFCSYRFFVKYKDNYCPIKKIYGDNDFKFVCEVPNYVLSGTSVTDNLRPTQFDLYFIDEFVDTFTEFEYKNAVYNKQIINKANAKIHNVYEMDDLKNTFAFVNIVDNLAFSGESGTTYINVSHNIINSNNGQEIIVYMDDEYTPLQAGEKITFIDKSAVDGFQSLVYNSNDYKDETTNGLENEKFIVYNGEKYPLEANIKDKVVIETVIEGMGNNKTVEVEYDVDYPTEKKPASACPASHNDCIVNIDGEEVPFKILNISGGTYSGGEIQRYGLIVSGCSRTLGITTGKYSIKPYSGVTIDGERYIVKEYVSYNTLNGDGGDAMVTKTKENTTPAFDTYADINTEKKYTFVINEILGNSTLVCSPYVNEMNFSKEFIRYISNEICSDVVSNKSSMMLSVDNKIFGDSTITQELAFKKTHTPISSDDYYDLFNDLVVYLNSGYIHIPLMLDMKVANNIMQDDIVTREFFDVEKKKAINPIVDMEKDVYIPKYFDGVYKGAETKFKPITQINLNFHFRTRYLDSWKVKEDYNDYETSADTTDNSTSGWFVTDFYPYKNILEDSGNTLQNTSDLMGLLYFSNNDIFYQKSRVAKSFARLSYYDSTDSQSQSLLATSSVFVDEHKLYKKFINNSRKNVYDYGFVTEPEFKKNDDGYTITPKVDVTVLNKANKINVMTEFIDKKDKKEYSSVTRHCGNILIDEEKRISSKLEINSRYATDTSSEGFYLYIFREYSEKLHPKPIYMRVDFNHAGIGRTIPFIIPMHWSGNTNNSSEKAYNKLHPDHKLSLSSSTDVIELKQGIPLSSVNSQLYIPLYAVYDFINKEYAYVFDKKYVDVKDGIANINLFEMKIQNETKEPTNEEIIDISKNQQVKGIININTDQFSLEQFNTKVE